MPGISSPLEDRILFAVAQQMLLQVSVCVSRSWSWLVGAQNLKPAASFRFGAEDKADRLGGSYGGTCVVGVFGRQTTSPRQPTHTHKLFKDHLQVPNKHGGLAHSLCFSSIKPDISPAGLSSKIDLQLESNKRATDRLEASLLFL